MNGPIRVQLSRKKGWRMPPGTVKVDRSTRWGNPFLVERERGERWNGQRREWQTTWSIRCLANPHHDGRLCPPDYRTGLSEADALTHAIERFRAVIAPRLDLENLRGKNLACWCRADKPCHADILLELANQ